MPASLRTYIQVGFAIDSKKSNNAIFKVNPKMTILTLLFSYIEYETLVQTTHSPFKMKQLFSGEADDSDDEYKSPMSGEKHDLKQDFEGLILSETSQSPSPSKKPQFSPSDQKQEEEEKHSLYPSISPSSHKEEAFSPSPEYSPQTDTTHTKSTKHQVHQEEEEKFSQKKDITSEDLGRGIEEDHFEEVKNELVVSYSQQNILFQSAVGFVYRFNPTINKNVQINGQCVFYLMQIPEYRFVFLVKLEGGKWIEDEITQFGNVNFPQREKCVIWLSNCNNALLFLFNNPDEQQTLAALLGKAQIEHSRKVRNSIFLLKCLF